MFWSSNQNLSEPQSLNSYSYANDNPITKSDPTGRAGAMALAPLAAPSELLAGITSPLWALPAAAAGALALTGYGIYSLSQYYSGEPPNFQTSMVTGNGYDPDPKYPFGRPGGKWGPLATAGASALLLKFNGRSL
jgi:hypothetical protein